MTLEPLLGLIAVALRICVRELCLIAPVFDGAGLRTRSPTTLCCNSQLECQSVCYESFVPPEIRGMLEPFYCARQP